MKLWSESPSLDRLVERFTVGHDRELDLRLARFDVIGSLAHGQMLNEQGILSEGEWGDVKQGLEELLSEIERGDFVIDDRFEDVHSKIEAELIKRVGEGGKKIHTARSRNDQVLLDMHLWAKEELSVISELLQLLFDRLLLLAERHQEDPMPGYTHMQVAMPSSFGLWFGAHAEALIDDVTLLKGAARIADQNPLGSAAGFGSSFPIDRERTTELLGFGRLRINAVSAGLSRGKLEWLVAIAFASIAATVARMAGDIVLYSGGNFGFFSLPEGFVTGSSIMPHKKNPDVFELIRAHCNLVRSAPEAIATLTTNLPTGYHRDYQLLKELLFPAATRLRDSLVLAERGLSEIQVQTDWQEDDRYAHLYTVEEVNRLVREGVPFRDAYMQVAESIREGTYQPSTTLEHTHVGSVGNPAFEAIRDKMKAEL
jgi:argininosuccinate lyase